MTEAADFRGLLSLRRRQIDQFEARVLDMGQDGQAIRRDATHRMQLKLARLADRLPWNGQHLDRGQRDKVRKVRRQMLDVIDEETARMERRLLPPDLRGQ